MTDTFGPVLGPIILWIPILVVVVLVALMVRTQKGRPRSSEQRPAASTPEPAPAPSSTPTTPPTKKGAGEKSSLPTVVTAGIMIALVAAVILLVPTLARVINAAVPAPGPSRAYTGAATRTSSPPQRVTTAWQRIVVTSDWSSWISIPPGYQIWYCDIDVDTGCSAADFSQARFSLECRDLTGQSHAFDSGQCRWGDANRVRTNSSPSFTLLYRLAPAP